MVFTVFIKALIAFIEGQKRLDETGYPEEADKAGDKQEYFIYPDIRGGEVTFRKQYADKQEGTEPGQLKYLQT